MATIYSKGGTDAAISAATGALTPEDVGADPAGTAAAAIDALGLGTAAVADATDFAPASSAAYPVQQVTLTGDLAYALPVDAPADQVISVVFTQDGTGGHTVTYGGAPVTVDTTAGAQTEVELWPNGTATRTVVYPGAAGAGVEAEGVQDVVGAMVVQAGGTYDDAAGTITLPTGGATRGLVITDSNVATIPAGDAVDNLAAYYNSGSAAITVQGTSIAAGAHAVWAWVAGAWTLLAAGTGGSTPEPTALPAPTGLAASVDDATNTVTATWAAVSGASGYFVRLDGGVWADSGADTAHVWSTGLLDGSSHTFEVAAYDAMQTAGTAAMGSFQLAAAAEFTATTDHFAAPSGTVLSSWTGGGLTWVAPLAGDNGVTSAIGTINNQRVGGGTFGASTTLPASDAMITVAYRQYGGQVRLHGRGSGARINMSSTSSVSQDCVGNLFTTGIPAYGVLSLGVYGQTATVFIDGVSRATFPVTTESSSKWGFATYSNGTNAFADVLGVKVEPWDGVTAPTFTHQVFTPGTILTSESFSGSGALAGSLTDAALGGAPYQWRLADGGDAFTRTGGQATRVGTTYSSSWIDLPTSNVELSFKLVSVPTDANPLRVHVRRTPSMGGPGMTINATSAAPIAGGSSFGTPQPGDVYSVKIVGNQLTITAKRSDNTPIGVGTQTFTDSSPEANLGVGFQCTTGNAGTIIDDVVVTAR